MAFRIPDLLDRSITISVKLPQTQSVVMPRISRVSRKSDARKVSSTTFSTPVGGDGKHGTHVGHGELRCRRGTDHLSNT